jgi:hypothetical protein
MDDNTTDHRPLVVDIRAGGAMVSSNGTKNLCRRNYKRVMRTDLETALLDTDWSEVYKIKDVEATHAFIVVGITKALDEVAPLKDIRVKLGSDLYLARDTLDVIAARNSCRSGGARYRFLRNKASPNQTLRGHSGGTAEAF